MSTDLGPKAPGHDQRKCHFLVANPCYDRGAIPAGANKARLPLFNCLYKGEERPLITTMVKCRYCRNTGLWYQPRHDSPDASLLSIADSNSTPQDL